jgi:hypothetical protein
MPKFNLRNLRIGVVGLPRRLPLAVDPASASIRSLRHQGCRVDELKRGHDSTLTIEAEGRGDLPDLHD